MDPNFWSLVGGALSLEPSAFALIDQAPNGLRIALLVLLLAGASETLGQAVVLVLNRVTRARFALALFLGGLELVLEALLWMVSVWLIAGLIVERPPFNQTVRAMGLAFAPMLLGFLIFLPYLGPFLAWLLRLWVLLAAIVATSVVFGLPPLAAALTTGVGFLARALLLRAFSGVFHTAQRTLQGVRA